MAEVRESARWSVLPCVETMALAHAFAPLRLAAELTLLPITLVATLPFRAQTASPDAIVLAARAQFVMGLTQQSMLGEVFAETPTLLMTERPTAALQRSAARLHIVSVLPMDLSAHQWMAAVAATAAGLSVALPQAGSEKMDRMEPAEHLTGREVEVLRLMARGYRNKQVATLLHISEHTVKFHVSSVIAKLGARTRTEAVTIGVTRGLVAI